MNPQMLVFLSAFLALMACGRSSQSEAQSLNSSNTGPVEIDQPTLGSVQYEIPLMSECSIFMAKLQQDHAAFVEKVEGVLFNGANSFSPDLHDSPVWRHDQCMPRITFRNLDKLTQYVNFRAAENRLPDQFVYKWNNRFYLFNRNTGLLIDDTSRPKDFVFKNVQDGEACDQTVYMDYLPTSVNWIDWQKHDVTGVANGNVGLSCGLSIEFKDQIGYLNFLAFRQSHNLPLTYEVVPFPDGKSYAVLHTIFITGSVNSVNGITVSN